MNLYPFDEVSDQAEEQALKGATIYQQFICAACGVKQTMEDKNIFYASGKCEECGSITDIRKNGCNFMAVFGEMKGK
jgi:hypothetical protein